MNAARRITVASRILAAVLVLLALAATTYAREDRSSVLPARAEDEAPVCTKCQSTGRLVCPQHPKDDCALEDAVAYCSVIADCPTCSGVGFVPCPECVNVPARAKIDAKKASVAARKVALAFIDKEMNRPIRKADSAHFILAWEIDRLKVDKRWVESHELMHLYLKRLEVLYADYCARMQITDKEFVEKVRVFVWGLPQDHHDAGLRFCRQSAKGGVKLMGTTPSYSVCGNKQNFADEEKLHRNIVHCVTHLLLSAQRPIAWIGNLKAGWVDEGLAHFFEDRYWSICDTYCFQEANTNVDFKGGKFRLAVRKMVDTDDLPPIAEVFQQNSDTLPLPMHAVSLSYVDFLLNKDAAKFVELVKHLKEKMPTRDALKASFGMTVPEFEGLWKSWVVQTYPTK